MIGGSLSCWSMWASKRMRRSKSKGFWVGYPLCTMTRYNMITPELWRREKHLYEKRRGRSFFQKYWNEKMKGKKEKRHKGFKPPFFRNNSQANQQGQSTQNEHKTTDSFGKMSRKQPVQCWECKENHLYKD